MQDQTPLPEEQLTVQDYDNDPRYQHLKSSDWLARFEAKFSREPQITVVPEPEVRKKSLDEFLEGTVSRIAKGREPSDVQYDLNALASAFQKLGRSYDPGFSYGHNRDIYRALILWAISHKDSKLDLNKGLFLYGPIGTGKTLALQILAHLLEADELRALHYTMTKADDIVDQVMTTGNFIEIKKLAYRHVFIDEVGQERLFINYFGNELCVMEKVLMYAYDSYRANRTFMHMSSNYEPEKFEQMYGPRVYSRMKEMFNFIKVDGIDLRGLK